MIAAAASSRYRIWMRRVALILVIAAVTHIVAVWALPRVIMSILFQRFPAAYSQPDAPQRLYRPPMTDAQQRGIVMPSPDLLYATCIYDLAHRPLRVRADPQLKNYWSVALYSANTDNFLVVNDRTSGGKPVDLLLVSASGLHPPRNVPDGVRVVIAPTDKGMVLTRMLVGDYSAEKAALEAARSRVSCAYWTD